MEFAVKNIVPGCFNQVARKRKSQHRIKAIFPDYFGTHVKKPDIPAEDFCRSCRSKDEKEKIFQLCECPALQNRRDLILDDRTLAQLSIVS